MALDPTLARVLEYADGHKVSRDWAARRFAKHLNEGIAKGEIRVAAYALGFGLDPVWAANTYAQRGGSARAERIVKFRCSFGRYLVGLGSGNPRLGWHDPHDIAPPGTPWRDVRAAYVESDGDVKRAKDRMRQQKHRTGTVSGS